MADVAEQVRGPRRPVGVALFDAAREWKENAVPPPLPRMGRRVALGTLRNSPNVAAHLLARRTGAKGTPRGTPKRTPKVATPGTSTPTDAAPRQSNTLGLAWTPKTAAALGNRVSFVTAHRLCTRERPRPSVRLNRATGPGNGLQGNT